MSINNFYNEIDLMYPELAINADIIDRLNPGTCRFYIPVLMPYQNKSRPVSSKIYLGDSEEKNLNVKPNLFYVNPVTISNYVTLSVPPEICVLPVIDENNRFIFPGNRWIVSFIGGDINFPVITVKIS